MPEPVLVPASLQKRGKPQRVSVYRNPDGSAAFAVMRWDKGGKKSTLPIIFNGEEFVNAGHPAPRPLYNSDEIAAHPDAPVLVVEGEKAAEDGARWLPDGWCITTWAAGTNGYSKTDWSLLKGRRVVIWPDNDEPGLTAAESIAKLLGPTAAVVGVSKAYPKGWDLADPLPDGITEEAVATAIQEAFERTAPPPAPMECVLPDAEIVDDQEDGFVDEHVRWRALGFDDSYYYIMPGSTNVVIRMTAQQLMSASGCLRIVNDLATWQASYGSGKTGIDWQRAGAWVMAECERAGFYDESRLRGRGVWHDAGRVVVNTGDRLLVDNRVIKPVEVKSKSIYQTSEALLGYDWNPRDVATDAEGRLIVELCNAPRWDKPVHGDLLAGWIATSLVCGALAWRTHIWVTGNAGSGKSTIINTIAAACVGDVAAYPMGETTEAGIRQFIGSDARPIIFDEMEGTDAQRAMNDNRRQAIIQLMRMASSDSPGRIMKGGAAHKGVAFTMRSSFLVASIGMSLREAPDLTRTLVLSLRPLASDATQQEKDEAEERYAMLNKLAARLPSDISGRLFARQIRLVPTLLKNAQMFREVIADMLGNRRLGDQVGTLLAGRCSLTSDRVMTREECEEYVSRFEWRDVVVTPADREDRQLLNFLKQKVVRIVDDFGKPAERTIGELVDIGLGMALDESLAPDKVGRIIGRFGIRADRIDEGVYLSSRNEELNKMFRGSTNPVDWFSVVSRNPKAVKSKALVRFAGNSTPAILIPKGEWYA